MTRKSLYLLISTALFVLACGVAAPKAGSQIYANTEPTAEMSTDVNPASDVVTMYVKAQNLNLRDCGSVACPADPKGLEKGKKVEVYLTCTGGIWKDWVALDVDCTQWVRSSWLEAK